jgi:hypothetical protein
MEPSIPLIREARGYQMFLNDNLLACVHHEGHAARVHCTRHVAENICGHNHSLTNWRVKAGHRTFILIFVYCKELLEEVLDAVIVVVRGP